MTGEKNSKLILIVEDSEEDYEAVLRLFKKVHVSNPSFWCRTGRSALDYLRHQGEFEALAPPRPGLVLLDLNMPGLDGLKTLQLIRQDEALKEVPVVILTTSGHDHDITNCHQSGASAYIQKPVTFENLLGAIKDLKDFWFELDTHENGDSVLRG
jgi:CheY-like chemotaxis protein